MGDTMRLFVAVPLPDDIHDHVWTRQRALAGLLGDRKIKWVPRGNHHITLVFLGSIAKEDVSTVMELMQSVLAGFSPISLELGEEGWFDRRGQVRVLFRKVGGEVEALAELAGALRQRLSDIAEPDTKPFRAHITVGRVRRGSVVPETTVQRALRQLSRPESVPWNCDRIILFSSQLRPQGPVYTPVFEISLG